MTPRQFLTTNGITQAEAALGIGMKRSALGNKLMGIRPWFKHEIDAFLTWAAERLGRSVTYEEAFGDAAPASLPPAVGED